MARLDKSAYVLAVVATLGFAAACGTPDAKDTDDTDTDATDTDDTYTGMTEVDANTGWRLQFAAVDWKSEG
ncbi:MAG: hypothetical protein H6732_04880 [Alphaproteobacteria bacterium]|nr:hypothetical protein [Alphaproteobacteria bacterium]